MAGMSFNTTGAGSAADQRAFKKQLNKVYTWYIGGFIVFIGIVALLEQMGVSRSALGIIFLLATVALYAGIGVMSRTTDADEYYVAGRRVPAMYNGMATGADWMSAASFIGMAGTVYLAGYGGLAFILGWTGGYCLVALFLAPYLRKFGQFTIPDFLGARYEGNLPRFIGILVCSFLGGMRAVTWTQVAQYIILIVAYLIPVIWLSVVQTGNPIPQSAYGYQLQKVTEVEKKLATDPKELEVRGIFRAQADALSAKLKDVPTALAADKAAAEKRLADLKASNAPAAQITAAETALAAVPADAAAATRAWTAARTAAMARTTPLGGMPPHAQQFAGNPDGDAAAKKTFDESRRNFLALVFCLMVGTAALPHILVRYYTTPSVKEARDSVTWSLFFIFLLYFTAPALAVLVKYEVFSSVVGLPFDKLPAWIANWSRVDPTLLSVVDINKDNILQLGELRIGGDIIVLATPEIGGLPYVISGLVAAGGLAAALSTADGLLLTIANALSHDLYYKMIDPNAPTARRVTISKSLLVVVAIAAAYVAAQKPADILFLVSAAFSFAAASFFPALTLGIFWKRANKWGAVLGMIAGLSVTVYYMATTQPWLRGVFGVTSPIADNIWWGILPISAGVFGVPIGFAVIIIVSLLTPSPSKATQDLVEHVRYPNLLPARA